MILISYQKLYGIQLFFIKIKANKSLRPSCYIQLQFKFLIIF